MRINDDHLPKQMLNTHPNNQLRTEKFGGHYASCLATVHAPLVTQHHKRARNFLQLLYRVCWGKKPYIDTLITNYALKNLDGHCASFVAMYALLVTQCYRTVQETSQ